MVLSERGMLEGGGVCMDELQPYGCKGLILGSSTANISGGPTCCSQRQQEGLIISHNWREGELCVGGWMPACLCVLMKHMAHNMLKNRGSGWLVTIALAQSSQNVTENLLQFHQEWWEPFSDPTTDHRRSIGDIRISSNQGCISAPLEGVGCWLNANRWNLAWWAEELQKLV